MSTRFLEGLFRIIDAEKRKTNETKERHRNDPSLLSEDERQRAEETKERTLRLLRDALKKRQSLLVEDPKEFGDGKIMNNYLPLVTTDLVKELIQELEKVTFTKNTSLIMDIVAIAYVHHKSEERTIYLCATFWKYQEPRSQKDTIIHEVSHFLGYGHIIEENSDEVKKSPQSMLCPLTSYSIASALTLDMDHPKTYTNGSYPCCGETSRDTVCEKSWMGNKLRFKRRINRIKREILLLQRHTAGD